MFAVKVCVLLMSLAAISVEAALTLPGKCPDYTFTNALDMTKNGGDWYIIQYAENGFSLGDKLCEVKKLVAKPNNGFDATLTIVNGGKETPFTFKVEPIASQVGKYETKVGDKPTVYMSFIDSDEKNYGVVLLCTSDGEKHGHFVEVLSRKRTLEPSFVEKAKVALAAAKITDTLKPNDPNC